MNDELEREIDMFVANTDIFVRGDQKLGRMRSLMRYLGDPQNRLRVVHIAGTSGKTSTCYFVAAFLKSYGMKVGLTVSPHVVDVRERAQIDLRVFDRDEFGTKLKEFFEIVKRSGVRPSYFEFYMAFAYWLFEREKVDYAVVETGLGGLYDGSNVVENSDKVCVITDIGFDHVEVLGETIEEIAMQKAGIIGSKNRVFINRQPEMVDEIVAKRANEMKATMLVSDGENVEGLSGFMARNASLARFVVENVVMRPMASEQIAEAATVKIPARAEEFEYRGKKVVADGSHNPQKIRALVDYMKQKYRGETIAVLASFGENKSSGLTESMRILKEISDEIVLTSFQDDSVETSKRKSIEIEEMERAAKNAGFLGVEKNTDASEALEIAIGREGEVVLVTGSFYLLNDVLPIIS